MRLLFLLVLASVLLTGCNSYSQKNDNKISREGLLADFKQVTARLETQVPDPYYLCSKTVYDSVKQAVASSLDSAMTPIEFYQKMQPLFMLLKDAHFQLLLNRQIIKETESSNSTFYFPMTVFIDSTHIFVNNNVSSDRSIKKGDEIVAINGMPAKEILNKLRCGISYNKQEEQFFEHTYEALFYYKIAFNLNFTNNFTIQFKNKTIKVPGVSTDIIEKTNADTLPFSYKLLENRIGYLKIGTLLITERQKLDSCLAAFFALLKKENIHSLIVDIRNNGGGSTQLAGDVFNYITTNKYKVSLNEVYFKDGKKVVDTDTSFRTPKDVADKFTGKTILLSNIASYSSSHMMANTFQYYKMGSVVGQTSVEPLYISGEVTELITQNTKCRLYLPSSNFALPGYTKDSVTYFVPDYQVDPTIQDKILGKDKALEVAVGLLKGK